MNSTLKTAWYAVALADNSRKSPGAFQLFEQDLVSVADGVLVDRCPHRNVPLSAGSIKDGCIVCPYHGWQFTSAGKCVHVPGLQAVPEQAALHATAVQSQLQQGIVWATLSTVANGDPYKLPLLDDASYTHLLHQDQMQGRLANVLENFLDGLHTHYVHSGLIRTEGERKPVNVTVRSIPNGVEAEYRDEGQQSGLISKLFGGGIDVYFGRFIYPSVAQLEYQAKGETRLLVTLLFSPATEAMCNVIAVASGKVPFGLGGIAKAIIRPMFAKVLQQDKAILALQEKTIAKQGGTQFAYTDLDVLMPHIQRLLKHGPNALRADFEQHSTMWL